MFRRLKQRLFELPRPHKRVISVGADLVFVLGALWAAFALRFENPYWLPSRDQAVVFGATLVTTIFAFVRLGLYRAVIRYISEKALMVMLIGVLVSASSLILYGFLAQALVPRSVPVIYGAFVFTLVAGTRFGFRSLINRPREKAKGRVLIVGTGPTALQLSSALVQGTEYRPMGFVSLDARKHKALIAGLPVYGEKHLQRAVQEQGIQRIFLALDPDSDADRKALIKRLEGLGLPVQTIPSVSELTAGQARINDIRDLAVEDLLGRDPVKPDLSDATVILSGKSVMVTGAGGSIGAELCRQIIRHRPAVLVLFEQSEFSLYAVERELAAINRIEALGVRLVPVLGNVCHRRRCTTVMRSFQIKVLFHAAAYKHVPLVEHNVIEGVQNNVFGTWHTAEAAINAGVERFVLISTDKAVRPTNVMGASKRLAELTLQALASRQSQTVFSMVRFGNVLGSSGSVVPLFRDQIRDGGPVTVTHPDITRYFMTIPEASQLVLQAAAMGQGGEVFVLDMGESVKIADLARKMVRLMGLTEKTNNHPDGDIEIVFTGLRPGEKLYEELLIGDDPQGTSHPRIMMAHELSLPWPELEKVLEALMLASRSFDCRRVVELLQSAPLGFRPVSGLEDHVWCEAGDVVLEHEADRNHGNKVSFLY